MTPYPVARQTAKPAAAALKLNLHFISSPGTPEATKLAIDNNHRAIKTYFEKMLSKQDQDTVPTAIRALLQYAGVISNSAQKQPEVSEAAKLAINDLMQDQTFAAHVRREKHLDAIKNWQNLSEQQLTRSYNFALAHNTDPIVSNFVFEEFCQASNFIRAGSLARCLAGTNNGEIIQKAQELIDDTIWAPQQKKEYQFLSLQHLTAPIILRGNSQKETIALLGKALHMDPLKLADLFSGLKTSTGYSNSDLFLKFVARELTPKIAFDIAWKSMLDPKLPTAARISLFANFLIERQQLAYNSGGSKLQQDLLEKVLNSMNRDIPGYLPRAVTRFIQSNSLRKARECENSFFSAAKARAYLDILLLRPHRGTKEYMNQVQTITAFLIGKVPAADLSTLIKNGHDRRFYDRAKKVLSGDTGRQEFFVISPENLNARR